MTPSRTIVCTFAGTLLAAGIVYLYIEHGWLLQKKKRHAWE